MGQITIRGMAPEAEKQLREISKATGKSLNRVIKQIVYRHIGFHPPGATTHGASLRDLAGGWSKQEAADFMETIRSAELIDPQLWQ